MQTTKGREVRRPILLLRVGSYGTCQFIDMLRSGNQNLPCRSLRSMANHFVQFLNRVWQLQHMSASQRGCRVTASSAVRIIVEWQWPHRLPVPSTFRSGRRWPCRAGGVVRVQTCRWLVWSLCRDARLTSAVHKGVISHCREMRLPLVKPTWRASAVARRPSQDDSTLGLQRVKSVRGMP